VPIRAPGAVDLYPAQQGLVFPGFHSENGQVFRLPTLVRYIGDAASVQNKQSIKHVSILCQLEEK